MACSGARIHPFRVGDERVEHAGERPNGVHHSGIGHSLYCRSRQGSRVESSTHEYADFVGAQAIGHGAVDQLVELIDVLGVPPVIKRLLDRQGPIAAHVEA